MAPTDTDVLVRTGKSISLVTSRFNLITAWKNWMVAGRSMTWWWPASAWSPIIATSSAGRSRNGGIDGLIDPRSPQEQGAGSESEKNDRTRQDGRLDQGPDGHGQCARPVRGRPFCFAGWVVFDFSTGERNRFFRPSPSHGMVARSRRGGARVVAHIPARCSCLVELYGVTGSLPLA